MNTKDFNKKLLDWFHLHGRKDLPWQKNPTPYRVWVSEIMLQQTQVLTVIPYYLRFMKRFPTITSLANAHLDEVLQLWTGLGYYARARNLHKTASIIQEKHQGQFPLDFNDVHALPGIGRSTAGAILALSSEQRFPILDGNVKRVLARYFGIHGFPGLPKVENTLWELSHRLLPNKEIRNYTQALMDLGATLCTRSQAKCEICPFQKKCYARQNQQQHSLPSKKPSLAKPTRNFDWIVFYHASHHHVLLEKRPTTGIWGGLWSFPEFFRETPKIPTLDSFPSADGKSQPEKVVSLPNASHDIQTLAKLFLKKTIPLNTLEKKAFLQFTHTFTHFHLDISVYLFKVTSRKMPSLPAFKTKTLAWYNISHPLPVGIPAPVQRVFKELQCHLIPSSV